ncbi:hypothetical protein GUJ93_ZPchr0012g20367 [Zizania palustris]|uniref:Uncharacterized protein n=1 Tax=Zizania palustris TaxID=103762 RepID=A0A8J6BS12_ZIZPA|nr:hypothetical protein GUJ93_ZPchr0012g20367 [Zizania palustris]
MPGRPKPADTHTTKTKCSAAIETRVLARESPELDDIRRREFSWEEGGMRLWLEHRNGEEAKVLELLRLAEELHRKERVGRRHRNHGINDEEVEGGRWKTGGV